MLYCGSDDSSKGLCMCMYLMISSGYLYDLGEVHSNRSTPIISAYTPR